jgi:hypothetical protein
MPQFPKSIETLNEVLASIGAPSAFEFMGASNVQIVSPRSIRFDLPDGKAKDNINRVKITAREDGTIDIRLFEMRELDLIGGIAPANVASTIEAFTGLKFK